MAAACSASYDVGRNRPLRSPRNVRPRSAEADALPMPSLHPRPSSSHPNGFLLLNERHVTFECFRRSEISSYPRSESAPNLA